MKVWYYGVCDDHKEAMTIYVSNPGCTAHYLGDYDEHIQAFLERHYGCTIRLVHLDLDLDKLWGNYTIFDNETGEVKNGTPRPDVCNCVYAATKEEPDKQVRIWRCPTCWYKEEEVYE